MERWIRVFRRFDTQEKGSFTIDSFFQQINVDLTEYSKDIFTSQNAINSENEIEFGDFLKVMATFCFFGSDELLKSLFVFCDINHCGYLSSNQFMELVSMLQGHKRISKSWFLRAAPDNNYKMYYEQFKLIHQENPVMLHPAFLLQKTLRMNTMGEEWWRKKLESYKSVREIVSGNLSAFDRQADIEIERFKVDVERGNRMNKRAEDIKLSRAFPVKLALLHARQFLDEFS